MSRHIATRKGISLSVRMARFELFRWVEKAHVEITQPGLHRSTLPVHCAGERGLRACVCSQGLWMILSVIKM